MKFLLNSILNVANIRADSACMAESRTSIVNFHAHVQRDVQNALISILAKDKDSNLNNEYIAKDGEPANIAATRSYLGTIMEELNTDLYKYKVQVNLVLDPLEMPQISLSGSADPSCELGNALKSRTQTMYNSLVDRFSNNVGVHFAIFSCISSQEEFQPVEVIEKGNCGRVVGIMWSNSDKTRNALKSAIMNALTGTPNMYANGTLNMSDKNTLCIFSEKCISSVASPLGQTIDKHMLVTFTKNAKGVDEEK